LLIETKAINQQSGITHNLGNSQISGRERENAMARRKRKKRVNSSRLSSRHRAFALSALPRASVTPRAWGMSMGKFFLVFGGGLAILICGKQLIKIVLTRKIHDPPRRRGERGENREEK
jgi:hypothetical protein